MVQFRSLEVALGSVDSRRGSVGDEALGEMEVDTEGREQEEHGRRVGKVCWEEDWESGESGERCFVEDLDTNGFEEDILS